MSEQQTPAASSPAEVFLQESTSFAEMSHYRQTGELPERYKPAENQADAAPADAPEKTVEADAPDSDPEQEQEPPAKGSGAEKRIKQLLAEKKELQRRLEEAAKQGVKSDPPPAQAQQQANSKPTPNDTNPDGTPKYTDWEQYNEALIDWKAEEKLAEYQRRQAEHAHRQQLASTIAEVRQKFGEDFDTIIDPTAGAIINDPSLSLEIKRMVAMSDVAPELLHAIGTDPEGVEKLIRAAKSDPLAAIRHIALLEAGIKSSSAKEPPARDGKGQFVAKEPPAPEKKKTSAPPPPVPVTGASSRAFDVSDDSLSNEEWARKRTEDRRRRGLE